MTEKLKQNKLSLDFGLFGIAGEIGLLISLPLVIFIPLAVIIDKQLNTLPLFIIGALFLSMIVSFLAVARKIKKLQSYGR